MSESRYIRHARLGSGRVVESDKEKVFVTLRSPDGSVTTEQRIDKASSLVKEIPPDSLGALIHNDPQKVYDRINNYDLEIIASALKEFHGAASQKDLKSIFEPIILYQKKEWNPWWKKISQKIKNSRVIQLDSISKKYFLINESAQLAKFDNLTAKDIQSFGAGDFTRFSQSILEYSTELKGINKETLVLLWTRLCDIIKDTSPASPEIIGLIAFGEGISHIISRRASWDAFLTEWLDNRELNLLGIRDSNLRYLGLQAVSRIHWPSKTYTLARYIVAEESSEKNRSSAARALWNTCQYQPHEFFSSLLEAARKHEVAINTPMAKISARAERIIICLVPFAKDITDEDSLNQYCLGCGNVLLSIYTKITKVPMAYAATKTALDICFHWRSKIINTLQPEYRWLTWKIFLPVFKACEEYAVHKYLKDGGLNAQLVSEIQKIIVEKANQGQIDTSDEYFSIMITSLGKDSAVQELTNLYNQGSFKSSESVAWALKYVVSQRRESRRVAPEGTGLSGEITEYAYHQRETEIAMDYATFLLFLREQEHVMKSICASYEELVNFYDQTKVDLAHKLSTFFELLRKHADTVKARLKLEYVDTVGVVEEYNPNRHHLIGEPNASPKYVEILIPGIGRRTKNGPVEILKKAIVKSV